MIRTAAVSALAVAALASAVSADVVTYRFTGTADGASTPAGLKDLDLILEATINLDTVADQLTATRAQYENAVVAGFFQVGDLRWNLADDPRRNRVIVRTDFVDINSGNLFNQMIISFSAEDVSQGGYSFPGNITLTIFDQDRPADTVLDLGLLQPLDTLKTLSQGGVDKVSASMGIATGSVFTTVGGGDGGIVVVPTPGALATVGVAGLVVVRRRR